MNCVRNFSNHFPGSTNINPLIVAKIRFAYSFFHAENYNTIHIMLTILEADRLHPFEIMIDEESRFFTSFQG